jgi:hypothetical protein
MNILVIGDIVGRPGRKALRNMLPDLQQQHNISFTIANAENAAGGIGLTKEVMNEILASGVDVLTMGNHVWDKKEIYSFIDDEHRLVRPINYPGDCPGQGFHIYTAGFNRKITVINASGRVFMPILDCPFCAVDDILEKISDQSDCIIIDFHAEATSEKLAFGYYFDGRVTAVLGTHTHVQTADEQILPKKTAYITDLGMTGPADSILGVKKELVIKKFLTQRPVSFEVAKGGTQFQGVIINIDDNNEVININRVSLLSKK